MDFLKKLNSDGCESGILKFSLLLVLSVDSEEPGNQT